MTEIKKKHLETRMNFWENDLQYECEEALLRSRFEQPSEEEEWQRFRQRVVREEEGKRIRRMRHIAIALLSMTAVALVVVFLSVPFMEKDTSSLSADVEHRTVLVESIPPEPVIVEEYNSLSDVSRTTTAISSDERPIGQEGIVMTSSTADYTHVKANANRRHTISIPRGQVYKITLSDSSEVWMNAGSRLSFPTRFGGDERLVRLEGEAYFKVARNEKSPFIVTTDRMNVRVLGTEFNMKVHRDSEAHVTLIDGAVQVHLPEMEREVCLSPGEDIVYNNGEYQVKKIDAAYYTHWKDGYFYFDDAPLPDMLKELGNWYNVTVEMEPDSMLMNRRLHFVAERREKIDHVIENLNAYSYLSVKKAGNKIIVMRKK